MKVTCSLGRIAPVPEDPKAELQGERNAKRWSIDIEYDGKAPVKLEIKLLDYGTGKPIPDNGLLEPQYACLTRAAARACIYFPEILDDKLFVVIEPEPQSHVETFEGKKVLVEGAGPPEEAQNPQDPAAIHIRLRVDAVHSLMR